MDLTKLEKSINRSRTLIMMLLIFLPGSYFVWFYLVHGFSFSSETSAWGEFGDYIGGILNPLIALFAVYWLTHSILIQKQELSETKNVLEETQKSQEKQAELSLLAANIQSLNIRIEVINSEISAKRAHQNKIMGAVSHGHIYFDENGSTQNVTTILKRLGPEINILQSTQTD